jgi:hypothetical protein
MVSHKNYNLHANEDFVMRCYEIDFKILEPIKANKTKIISWWLQTN